MLSICVKPAETGSANVLRKDGVAGAGVCRRAYRGGCLEAHFCAEAAPNKVWLFIIAERNRFLQNPVSVIYKLPFLY